jgi:hypothetical protein
VNNTQTGRLYARYAVVLLALTLVAGAYIRAAFAWPAVRGGIATPYMIHAHSHAGFFGWMVMAAAAAIVLRLAPLSATSRRLHRVLAHAIGVGSFAAFIGFALRGYDTLTIALSALHVGFWIVLVAAVWRPLARTAHADAALLLRGGLVFLVLAGLATTVPAVMMVRQVTDPWLVQFGVKLFLTPFVSGFLVLTAAGLLCARCTDVRYATTVLALIAAGTLPATLLYVPGPPAEWLIRVGRCGIGLVGAGVLLFAADLLAGARRAGRDLPPLALLAVGAAMAVGIIKLLAAAGIGATFMHNRSITVTVLHLILLGLVTPAFVVGARPALRAPVRTVAYAAGLLLMLVPLAATGWPWAARWLMVHGVGIGALLGLSAVGGIVCAAALIALTTHDAPPNAETPATAGGAARQDRAYRLHGADLW